MIIKLLIMIFGITGLLYAGDTNAIMRQNNYDGIFLKVDDFLENPIGPCNCQKNIKPSSLSLDTLIRPTDPKTNLRFKVLGDSLHLLVKKCDNLKDTCVPGPPVNSLNPQSCFSCSTVVANLVNFTKLADSAASKGDSIGESFNTRKWFWSYFANAATCATCDSTSFANAEKELFEKVFMGSYVNNGWNSNRFRNAFNSYPPDSIANFITSLKNGNDTIISRLLSSKDKDGLFVIFKHLLDTDPSLYGTFNDLLSFREVMLKITGEFNKVRASYKKAHKRKPSEQIAGVLNFWKEGTDNIDEKDIAAYKKFIVQFRKKLGESYTILTSVVEKNDNECIKLEINNKIDSLDTTVVLKIKALFTKPKRPISFYISGFYTVSGRSIQLHLGIIDDSLTTIPIRITRTIDFESDTWLPMAESLAFEIQHRVEDFEIRKELISTILKRPITIRDSGGLKGFSLINNYIEWLSQTKFEGDMAPVKKKNIWKFMVNDHLDPKLANMKEGLAIYLNNRFLGKLGEAPNSASDTDCIRLDLSIIKLDSLEIGMFVGGNRTFCPPVSLKEHLRSFEFVGNMIEALLITPEWSPPNECDTIHITTCIKAKPGKGLACASLLFPGVAHAALASYADSTDKSRIQSKAVGFIAASAIIKMAAISLAACLDYKAVTHTNNDALRMRNYSMGVGLCLDFGVSIWSLFSSRHEIKYFNGVNHDTIKTKLQSPTK